MVSKSTIKTIGKVLNKIKERSDLTNSLRVILKKEEAISMFGINMQELNGILKTLTVKKVIMGYEFDRTNVDLADSCYVYLPKDFIRTYTGFSKIINSATGETKTHIKLASEEESPQKNLSGLNHKFPHKLPAGTKWENITIKFEDNENVFIKVKQFEYRTSYKEMGFIGGGNSPKPSVAWIFLMVLSMTKITGELTIKDPEAKDKYKKQKEFLTKGLQNYFSIDYDPFYPYRSSLEKVGSSYKIKLTLVPPPEQKTEEDRKEKNDDELEIEEYLDDHMKQVYEEPEIYEDEY